MQNLNSYYSYSINNCVYYYFIKFNLSLFQSNNIAEQCLMSLLNLKNQFLMIQTKLTHLFITIFFYTSLFKLDLIYYHDITGGGGSLRSWLHNYANMQIIFDKVLYFSVVLSLQKFNSYNAITMQCKLRKPSFCKVPCILKYFSISQTESSIFPKS